MVMVLNKEVTCGDGRDGVVMVRSYAFFLFVLLLPLAYLTTAFLPPTHLPAAHTQYHHHHQHQHHHQQRMFHLSKSLAHRLRPVARRRGLGSMKVVVDVGDWVVLHESGRKARVINRQVKGWWQLEDQQSRHIFSARSGSFTRLLTPPSSTARMPEDLHPRVLQAEDYPRHAATRTWVVFSDLHVTPQTLPVCLEVLGAVQDEAKARGSGVVFLGDFWHTRGTFRVDVLNRVLEALRHWTQPVIMLPGNHDQVTMDGKVHGLTSIQYAFSHFDRQAVIVSEPTVFLRALWLPFARDPAQSTRMLRSVGKVPWLSNVQSIFCHADVKGASMNDNHKSTRGLPPHVFPHHIPTFSGHFHKPQTLRGGAITYIGSPYQTSLSEAGQQKRMLVLQGGHEVDWHEVGHVGMDLGRRFFRVTSLAEAESLLLTSPTASRPRPGDRVVMVVEDTTDPHLLALRDRLEQDLGVDVEVRQVAPSPALPSHLTEDDLLGPGSRGAGVDYEAIGPRQVLQAYFDIDETGVDPAVVEEGIRLVDEYVKPGPASNRVAEKARQGPRRLVLEELRMKGYGPYRQEVSYPLNQRGLVLLTGRNLDDAAADSNAAGKSKLAMAPLWALTGEADLRPVMDGKVQDVVFNVKGSAAGGQAPYAEVAVRGAASGASFEVTRRRGPSMNQLQFLYDGQDLTRQGTKETQKVVEETLGIDWGFLSLAVFCGQHGLRGLLESTDVELKERLAQVVVMDHWQDLANTAKEELRKISDRAEELDIQVRLHERVLEKEREQGHQIEERVQQWKQNVLRCQKDAGGHYVEVMQKAEKARSRIAELEDAESGWWDGEKEEPEGIGEAQSKALKSQERIRATLDSVMEKKMEIKRKMGKLERRYVEQDYVTSLRDLLGLQESDAEWASMKEVEVDDAMAAAAGVPLHMLTDKVKHMEDRLKVAERSCIALGDKRGRVEELLASLAASPPSGANFASTNLTSSDSSDSGVTLGEACPLCGHEWATGEHREHRVMELQQDLRDVEASMVEAEAEKRRLESELQETKRHRDSHREYLRDVSEWRELQSNKAEQDSREQSLMESLRGAAEQVQQLKEESLRRMMTLKEERKRRQEEYRRLQDELRLMDARIKDLENAEDLKRHWESQLDVKGKEISELMALLNKTKSDSQEAQSKMRVYGELQERLGVRGVQAFVYRGAVTQLERLTNFYLTLIGDGNLQIKLSLKEERISKEVMIRGSDGAYHTRSLSQLSGGQWRRASLAMLFAFRDLSRLRSGVDCNILVLDEVLSQLDAEGRSRVGRVLRMMCHQPPDHGDGVRASDERARTKHAGSLVSDGAVSTILVILQDLAAMELQDVFDKNDEVVKCGDISTVIVDDSLELGQGGPWIWEEAGGGEGKGDGDHSETGKSHRQPPPPPTDR